MNKQHDLNTNITKLQQRQSSETALKTRFNVDWLLYPYDGKHTDNYPGCIAATQYPAYGNCRQCHLMGPMGERCNDCDPDNLGFVSIYVLMLAQQQLCDPHERWYNPEFLHNTNGATRIVDAAPHLELDTHEIWQHPDAPTLWQRLCRRHLRHPYPEMLGLHKCGKENFQQHMRTIYQHPLLDHSDATPSILIENTEQVQQRDPIHAFW